MRPLFFLLLLAALPAAAQPPMPAPLMQPFFDRGTVLLRNNTPLPLSQFFLWNQAMAGEGEDRLQGQALVPGEARELVLGMGHCNISLRAVYADGSQAGVRLLDACRARELVLEGLSAPAARAIPR